MPETRPREWWIAAALAALVLAVYVAVAMTKPLNHDEQQFIAAGTLVARQGLLPYRDFPYFHTPNLPLLFGSIFSGTDYLLLTGRLISVFTGWLTALTVFVASLIMLQRSGLPQRRLIALGAGLMIATNPAFVYVIWKAWNHAIPLLLLSLALLAQWQGSRRPRSPLFILSGALIALAAGFRISYAPLALPFLIASCTGRGWRQRGAGFLLCALGMFIGSLPTLCVFAQDPAAFLFDNFAYNGSINREYRTHVEGMNSAMYYKFLFALRMIFHPAQLVLFAGFGWVIWQSARANGWLRLPYFLRFCLGLLPFAFIGVAAPTPSFSQYYSILIPILVLGLTVGMGYVPAAARRISRGIFTLAVLVNVICSIGYLGLLPQLAAPRDWMPVQMHEEGLAMREKLSSGRVFTIAPITPLEGRLPIYPVMASGPFAWRVAAFVPENQRARFKIFGKDELAALMKKDPPPAIYLRYPAEMDKPLNACAAAAGYRRVMLADRKKIWIRPDLVR